MDLGSSFNRKLHHLDTPSTSTTLSPLSYGKTLIPVLTGVLEKDRSFRKSFLDIMPSMYLSVYLSIYLYININVYYIYIHILPSIWIYIYITTYFQSLHLRNFSLIFPFPTSNKRPRKSQNNRHDRRLLAPPSLSE